MVLKTERVDRLYWSLAAVEGFAFRRFRVGVNRVAAGKMEKR